MSPRDGSDDAAWTLVVDGVDPLRERAHEALLTIADGRVGTRGSALAPIDADDPAVLMAGVYRGRGEHSELLCGPRWNVLELPGGEAPRLRRVLDLRTGTLRQELRAEALHVTALQFSSLARPATTALRVRVDRDPPFDDPPPLVAPREGSAVGEGRDGDVRWMRVDAGPGSLAAAALQSVRAEDGDWVLERVTGHAGAPGGEADVATATAAARSAAALGFDGLLDEHRRAWAACWEDADVRIEGDPGLQRDVRLALFHLLSSAATEGEAAVGARGLTGEAYRGHVFWDSDVYVLPFLAAVRPAAARAMLEYRLRRMPAALRAARARGRAGARFPWESAASGRDVTPRSVAWTEGGREPTMTGALEVHIVADVAWSAACYADWTGDAAFAAGPGRELLVQTARWWASRIARDEAGRAHLRDVMGPDEYHDHVDDSAYTNVMARWNLRRAAADAAGAVDEDERRRWLELADALVDGYDPATGVYEQFAGFDDLEPLVISEVAARRPVAADLLLGRDRVRACQVVKQADVVLLHLLVPGETAAGSLAPNLDRYEPLTAHGSSLSPGAHAALMARAGRPGRALDLLRLTSRIDLDDVSATSAGGVHLAAMGTVWMTLAMGFAGLRPGREALAIDPAPLPAAWDGLEVRVRFRGSRVRVTIDGDGGGARVRADPPVAVAAPDGEIVTAGPDGVALPRAAARTGMAS